jgi:hypothetical protein
MDDLADSTVDSLQYIEAFKVARPAFKVTLFTIPARCSQATLDTARALDAKYGGGWLQLAPHGWYHTRGECLGWTQAEAVAKITAARDCGIDAPIFRAPAWLLDVDTYRACHELGYVVASHTDFRVPRSRRGDLGDVKEYVYNDVRYRLKGTRSIHGHLSPVSGNDIKDMSKDGRLAVPDKHEFIHAQDAAVVDRG